MEHIPEPNELLLESEIISQEEKNSIIERIDRDFSNNFTSPSGSIEYTAGASGLRLPLIVISVMIVLTLGFLLFADTISRPLYPVERVTAFSVNTDSEWEILRTYMNEVSAKLNIKNAEILRYQDEIKQYDLKLVALRELINLKKETEERFIQERVKLQNQGLARDQIDSEITNLEKDLISNLNPDMVDFYNMSIEELNSRIDRILEDRSDTERKLETTVTEQIDLASETEDLKKTLAAAPAPRIIDNTVVPEKEIMEAITIKKQQAEMFKEFVNQRYSTILQNLEEGNYQAVTSGLTHLRGLLAEQNRDDGLIVTDEINLYFKLIAPLEEYTKLKIAEELPEKESEVDVRLKELETISREVLSGRTFDTAARKKEIRTIMAAIPGVQTALSALEKIAETERPTVTQETRPVTQETKPLTQETRPVIQESKTETQETRPASETDIEPYKFVGTVININFNTLTIKITNPVDVRKGEKFIIQRSNGAGNPTILAKGTLTEIKGEVLIGDLETLYDFSKKPELKDFVYILNNTAEN